MYNLTLNCHGNHHYQHHQLGATALTLACENGKFDVVEVLLRYNAVIDAQDRVSNQ